MLGFILSLFGYARFPKSTMSNITKNQLDTMQIYRASVYNDLIAMEYYSEAGQKEKYITENKIGKYKNMLESLDMMIDTQENLIDYFKSVEKINGGIFKKEE